jgi:gluconokinase
LNEIVIAVDIGSSGIKALAFDTHARAVPGVMARAAISIGGELDFTALRNDVESVLDDIHAQTRGFEVLAVGFGSFASSLVALDANARPLEPSLTYADTRSAAFCAPWRADDGLLERTGCPPYTSFWTAQVAWWLEHHPLPAKFVTVTDALFADWFRLETVRTSLSAAAWTGLLHRHHLTWDASSLERLGVGAAHLLTVAEHPAHTGLRPPFASRWAGFRRAPFFAGVADGFAANVGSGVLGAGHCAITIGTSAALRTIVTDDTPVVPSGLWALRCRADQTLIGGALTEGGNLRTWALEQLRLPPGDLEAALEGMPADGHGLTFVPTWNGERSPGYDPTARGEIHGLGFQTQSLDILRAAMEGVSYRLADLFQRLEATLGEQHTITLSGNALQHSRVWRQMIADTLGRTVVSLSQPEATARGIAALALQACGRLELRDLRGLTGETLEPDASRFAVYQRGLTRLKRFLAPHGR